MKLFQAVIIILMSLLATPAYAQDVHAGSEAYRNGDYAAALRAWRPLAERGDGEAQASLGLLYALGRGVPRDFATALEWFELSAAQGYAIGQNNLAVMYHDGQGVPQDYAAALKLFKQSAAQGYTVAQYSLGMMYEHGDGTQPDLEEAYMWYTLAAEQGHNRADEARLALEKQMTDDQKTAALARVLDRQKRDTPPTPSRPVEPAAAKLPATGDNAWRVQLAAVDGPNIAEAEWKKLQTANEDLLQDLKLHVQPAKLPAGTFYRVQAGPLADRATAASLCKALKSRRQDCLVVAPK